MRLSWVVSVWSPNEANLLARTAFASFMLRGKKSIRQLLPKCFCHFLHLPSTSVSYRASWSKIRETVGETVDGISEVTIVSRTN